MRVLLLTHGSRGDVQPFLALARGLAERGHRPRLAGPARSAALAAAHGIPFHPLDDASLDLQDLVAQKGTRAALTAARTVKPLLRRMLDTAATAIRDEEADLVVHHPKALAGPHLAEALGVPAITATLLPLYVPTSEFPLPMLPARAVPAPLARPSWRLVAAIDAPYRGLLRAWRRDVLDLPARSRTTFMTTPDGGPAPVPLHAWSRHLLPAPADWPKAARPLGYWLAPAPETWVPPAPLREFLDAGEPPVYLGFGSMVGRDPAGLARTVLDAVRRSGRRAVLATGWGGLRPGDSPRDSPGDDVLVLDQVPHDWLFPRCAAVVHHGGAGTVAAAARAGRPQVIRPMLADQPFWAGRVHGLGLGPAPLARRVDAGRLAAALTGVGDAALVERCRAMGEALRAEDGVAAAVDRLEHLAG
ncbi:MAG: sterol 3beta-glucosyltransferase [Actinomycetota bacterium]|nr:sterol 3beta-glucosyltransferase [Actinomycetota bacterium]